MFADGESVQQTSLGDMKFLKLSKDKDGVFLDTEFAHDKFLLDKKGLEDYNKDTYTGNRSQQFNYLFEQTLQGPNKNGYQKYI